MRADDGGPSYKFTLRDRGARVEQTQLGNIDCDSDIWAGFLVEVAFKLCLQNVYLARSGQ